MNCCHYHLIQYIPFPETGEFQNIGVVAYSDQDLYFEWKIIQEAEDATRVFGAFPGLPPAIWDQHRQALIAELAKAEHQFSTAHDARESLQALLIAGQRPYRLSEENQWSVDESEGRNPHLRIFDRFVMRPARWEAVTA